MARRRGSGMDGSAMDGLIAFENLGIERREELLVERLYRGPQVGFRHHETDVEQRSALRDHADVDAVESHEHAARHSWSVSNIFAHQTHDHIVDRKSTRLNSSHLG